MTASTPTKIVMSLVVAFTLLPTTYFIFRTPRKGQSKGGPTDVSIEMDERDSLSVSTAPPMPVPDPHLPPQSTSSLGHVIVNMQPAVGPMTPS